MCCCSGGVVFVTMFASKIKEPGAQLSQRRRALLRVAVTQIQSKLHR